MNKNLHVLEHPLVQHKLSYIRDKQTSSQEFRALIKEVAMFLAYDVTRNLPLKAVEVETPLEKTTCQRIDTPDIAIVPILRAGLGMVEGFLELLPAAKIGHIGLCRNEDTLAPVAYYAKLPKGIEAMQVILVDPMLATGGSATAALTFLKNNGVTKIKFAAIIAAPAGLHAVQAAHPEVEIYVAQVDRSLNDRGYIVPGLGDAGDRIFGTD